jgi:alcohol dehydrogenase
MEHALSAHHPELPHGAGLIILSASYFGFFADRVPDRFARMAEAMGKRTGDVSHAARPHLFLEALNELKHQCGVDTLKMSDYGVTKNEIPLLAKNAHATMGGLFALDRYTLTPEMTTAIMESAFS